MNEQMKFPKTFEEFAKEYGFKDDKEVYTNGSDLISIFRVKQWLENDNKLRRIETDTAYECGKHANKALEQEPLTDKEQRIFLAAMGREEKICREVDDKYSAREAYEDSLVSVCRSIERKVKKALWK